MSQQSNKAIDNLKLKLSIQIGDFINDLFNDNKDERVVNLIKTNTSKTDLENMFHRMLTEDTDTEDVVFDHIYGKVVDAYSDAIAEKCVEGILNSLNKYA